MSLVYTKNNNKYRDSLPFGSYDLVIITLLHQGPDLLHYMIQNIERFVKGKFLWIVHYNGSIPVSEEALPSWVWLVREPIQTERYTRSLTFAIVQCLKFALVNVQFTNIMTLSSGSVFFRDFHIPIKPKVALTSHEKIFDSSKNYSHIEEIPVCYTGSCAQFLEKKGSFGWQYRDGADKDKEFHDLVKARKFLFFRGCQWTGQIWPYEVAKMLVEDLSNLEVSNNVQKYACEEVYLSTYAYNYALTNSIEVEHTEVIIDWVKGYDVTDMNWVMWLIQNHKLGSAVCKVSDNIHHPIRQILNSL